ncbi:uncharacterized protein LOC143237893 isoform X2 [Tachypleus tridentatus]|uniref:uncharacterized protein LOC143237893 isoform X2 n=1 Tax=Tachypleus tridentatus TaxID=6853 RepID=UPI003FD3C564
MKSRRIKSITSSIACHVALRRSLEYQDQQAKIPRLSVAVQNLAKKSSLPPIIHAERLTVALITRSGDIFSCVAHILTRLTISRIHSCATTLTCALTKYGSTTPGGQKTDANQYLSSFTHTVIVYTKLFK